MRKVIRCYSGNQKLEMEVEQTIQ